MEKRLDCIFDIEPDQKTLERVQLLNDRLYKDGIIYTPYSKMGILIEYFGDVITEFDNYCSTEEPDFYKFALICTEILSIHYLMTRLMLDLGVQVDRQSILKDISLTKLPCILKWENPITDNFLVNCKKIVPLLNTEYYEMKIVNNSKNNEKLRQMIISYTLGYIIIFSEAEDIVNNQRI